MTIQELDKEIDLRKTELIDDDKKEAYNFIINFINNNKIDNILDYINMDIWEFLKCSIYINCNEKDINKCSKDVDSYKELFNSIKIDTIEKLLSLILTYYKTGKIDFVIDYFKTNGFINEIRNMSKFTEVSNSDAVKIGLLKRKLSNNNIDIIPLLENLKEYKEPFIDELVYYLTYRKIEDYVKNKVFEVYADPNNKVKLEQKKVKVLTSELEDFFNVNEILKKMIKIKEFVEEYERVEKNNQREINGLDSARTNLEKELDKKQIYNYRDIIKGIKSSKIKFLFLKLILEHNELYHEELNKELENLSQDSKVSIQALLNNYGINKECYDYHEIPKYSKDELESILKVITRLNITNEEKIRIIKNTSLEKIDTLKNYLDREILSTEYVSNNTYILSKETSELDNLKDNIELLKNNNISLSIFVDSISILMNNSLLINNNLNILNNYNLLKGLNNTLDFNFLLSDNLEIIIDKYLELGFSEYLENDLDLLNKKELERIEVLKLIGILITNREELDSILDEDKKFFIPKEEINKYLIDDSKYIEEPEEIISIDDLEQYKNNRVYNFNGVLISVEKVKRLLNNNYNLYQAIIYNTHLNEEELLSIKNIINNSKRKELKLN